MNDGAARGFVLVAVAAVIGIILLAQGFDDQAVSSSGGGAEDGVTVTTTAGGTQATVPGGGGNGGDINPADVLLVVANGAGVEGAAGAVTDQLFALGYNPGDPVDATSPDPTGLDTVYYLTTTRSFQPEAEQVAEDLGLTPDAVLPWPTDAPPAEPGFATVVVVLGQNGSLATNAVAAQGTTPSTVPG